MYDLKKDNTGHEFALYERPEAENPGREYDLTFASELKHFSPIYEVKPFLEYHYDRTPDQELFLKHIKFHILLFPFLKDKQHTKCDFIRNWIDSKELTIPKHQSESARLREKLSEYGFFNLELVKQKDAPKVIDLIANEHISYKIAIFEYLGFVNNLLVEYCNYDREKLYKTLTKILPESNSAIKKNVLSLSKGSRYGGNNLADTYEKQVEIDYQSL